MKRGKYDEMMIMLITRKGKQSMCRNRSIQHQERAVLQMAASTLLFCGTQTLHGFERRSSLLFIVHRPSIQTTIQAIAIAIRSFFLSSHSLGSNVFLYVPRLLGTILFFFTYCKAEVFTIFFDCTLVSVLCVYGFRKSLLLFLWRDHALADNQKAGLLPTSSGHILFVHAMCFYTSEITLNHIRWTKLWVPRAALSFLHCRWVETTMSQTCVLLPSSR